jgi:hypothetical protein
VWYNRSPSEDKPFYSDAPDILTSLQELTNSDTGPGGLRGPGGEMIRGWTAAGTTIRIEGVENLTKLEYFAFGYLQLLLEQFRQGLISEQFLAFLWLNYEITHGTGDFLRKIKDSHSFPSVFHGLLTDDSTGWNAYDRRTNRD